MPGDKVVVVLAAMLFVSALPAAGQGADPLQMSSGVTASSGVALKPGRWGMVRLQLINTGEQGQTTHAGVAFGDSRGCRFLRRIWMPPRSQRTVQWPVYVAHRQMGGVGTPLKAETLLYTSLDHPAKISRRTPLVMTRESMTLVCRVGQGDDPIVLVTAARELQGLSRSLMYGSPAMMPTQAAGLDGIDHLVLVADRVELVPAQHRALWQWVESGGSLWIVAHGAAPDILCRLLAGRCEIAPVDQVTLSEVQFALAEQPAAESAIRGQSPRLGPVVFEEPVKMQRVLASEQVIGLTVRGWPALISRPVGVGRLVMTTLGPRAWLDEASGDARMALSRTVFAATAPVLPPVEADVAQQYVTGQVGHQVASHQSIALVLGAYLVCLVLAAMVLHRRQRLETLAPVAVLIAVVAAVVVLAVGMVNHGGVPPTRASLQVVTAEPGESRALVQQWLGLYDAGGLETRLTIDHGWALPLDAGGGAEASLIWTGIDRLVWPQLRLPTGAMRTVSTQKLVELSRPLEMSMRFTEAGLIGELDWPTDEVPSDAMLVTPTGALPASLAPDDEPGRSIVRVVEQPLPRRAFVRSGMISETRQWRANVLKSFTRMTSMKHTWPGRPTLVVWAGVTDSEVELPGTDHMQRHGAAVWTVPLSIDSVRPGRTIRIPSPMIDLRVSSQHFGLRPIPLYVERHRAWLPEGTTQPAAFVGRFVLPPAVLPARITRATVHLNITALQRSVRLFVVRNGQLVLVEEMTGPDGRFDIELPPELLQLDSSGSLPMALDVGLPAGADAARASSRSLLWLIRDLNLSAEVVTLPEESSSGNLAVKADE